MADSNDDDTNNAIKRLDDASVLKTLGLPVDTPITIMRLAKPAAGTGLRDGRTHQNRERQVPICA